MGGLSSTAVRTAARLVEMGGHRAACAVVLGTGLGSLAERLENPFSLSSEATGWLASSRAVSHAGRVVCGRMRGVGVVALQGRVHAYEGHDRETICRGVQLAAALGSRLIVFTNAAGGLTADMVPGDVVAITDHMDLSLRGSRGQGASVHGDTLRKGCRAIYDRELVDRACAIGRCIGATVRRGVYAFVTGPSYETRAEVRLLRRSGADVVGMSTVPEAIAAAALGMRVLGLSVVTNIASPDRPVVTDADEVCRAASVAGDVIWAILESLACEF